MAQSWFEIEKELLEYELQDLTLIGIEYEIDRELKKNNILCIRLNIVDTNKNFSLPKGTNQLNLTVVFPDHYPYFRPEIYTSDLDLARHIHPIEKNLCLIERSTSSWSVSWSVATYLKEQLPKLFKQGVLKEKGEFKDYPNEQAEPMSEFYANVQHPVIFNNDVFKNLGTITSPTFLGKIIVGMPDDSQIPPMRLLVNKIYGKSGALKFELPSHLLKASQKTVEGILYALPKIPKHGIAKKDYQEFVRKLINEEKKRIRKLKGIKLRNGQKIKHVIGFTFPEEIAPGDYSGQGWLFLIVAEYYQKRPLKHKTLSTPVQVYYYAKAGKIDSESRTIRIPKLKKLQEKKIAVIGLGALGAPSAIEFAKSGVGELIILDFDVVEPGTVIRWPLGMSIAGFNKTEVIKKFIEENYPDTKVTIINHRLGSVRSDGKKIGDQCQEQDIIDELLNKTSLVYDASAELGVSHLLSQVTKKRGVPFISISATPGALGGIVLRVVPNKTEGCWMCFQYWKDKEIPLPPFDEDGELQPSGCGDKTFTGSHFDLQNVSLMGVRLGVSTFGDEHRENYPNLKFDVGILSLIDNKNEPIPPNWDIFELKKHPNCPYCNA